MYPEDSKTESKLKTHTKCLILKNVHDFKPILIFLALAHDFGTLGVTQMSNSNEIFETTQGKSTLQIKLT